MGNCASVTELHLGRTGITWQQVGFLPSPVQLADYSELTYSDCVSLSETFGTREE